MDVLQYEWFGNSLLNWTMAGIAALLAILLIPIMRGVARNFASRRAENTDVRFWLILDHLLKKTYFFVVLVVAVYMASALLDLPLKVEKVLSFIVTIGIFCQVVIWLVSLVDIYVDSYSTRSQKRDQSQSTALYLISFFVKSALISVIFLVTLDQLGVNITALVAGLGVGGIAVALAAQTILSDLFASLTIVLDKPFEVGDFLSVGDLAGTVERVGLKTTRLRSLSGEQLVFSNNDLLQSRVKNFKRMQQRRVVFSFSVTYETPVQKLKQIPQQIREIIESKENTKFDRAHFISFGESSLNFEVVYFVLTADFNAYVDIQQAINIELIERLNELKVELAYPTQKLYIRSEDSQEETKERFDGRSASSYSN